MKNIPKRFQKLDPKDLILHETTDYVITNKPAHISCLEDRNQKINLLSLLRQTYTNIQICHRIDKETSGIVVFAKNNQAYKHFALQLENREIKKVYHTVINGTPKEEDYELDQPIYVGQNRSKIDYKSGKPSLTLMKPIEYFKRNTLLKCFPVTGRMHQIRVHLSNIQLPIVNDEFYGGSPLFLSEIKRNYRFKSEKEERPIINRLALHAHEIGFKGLNDEIIEKTAPYPKDFSTLLSILKKYK